MVDFYYFQSIINGSKIKYIFQIRYINIRFMLLRKLNNFIQHEIINQSLIIK